MDASIRPMTIAEEAAFDAKVAVETGEPQPNRYVVGTDAHNEFHRRYCIALLRLTNPVDADGSA